MTKHSSFLLLGLCIAGFTARPVRADPVLHLLPTSGVVPGRPGSTVIWGLSVMNPDNNFVLLTDSSISAVPALGIYTDLIATSGNVIVGPSPESNALTVVQIGMFRILANAPMTAISGTLTVDYSVFSQDPNAPDFDPASFLANRSFSQSVTVDLVPEPGSLSLLAVSATLLSLVLLFPGYGRWFRRPSRTPLPQPTSRA